MKTRGLARIVSDVRTILQIAYSSTRGLLGHRALFSDMCKILMKQNNLNRVKQLIDKFIDYSPFHFIYIHT